MKTTQEKIEEFAAKVHQNEVDHLVAMKCDCQGNLDQVHPLIRYGKKYVKVDIGRLDAKYASGKYMIDLVTEEIFGIKAYGVIHRGHRYGTLDNPSFYYRARVIV
jgi:hypothetical protein